MSKEAGVEVSLFWFRRDLRLTDNRGLYEALRSPYPVVPLFIFDPHILDHLPDPKDARVEFIHHNLQILDQQIKEFGSGLRVLHAKPLEVMAQLGKDFVVRRIYCNEDYEPYARERDQSIAQWAQNQGIEFLPFKDQVIFAKDEVVKSDGQPYSVYTPYSKAWKIHLKAEQMEALADWPSEEHLENTLPVQAPASFLSLEDLGFTPSGRNFPPQGVSEEVLDHYKERRDFPAVEGTSRLGLHLRFGTVSVRKMVAKALDFPPTWLNELIWREFFMMILWYHPQTVDHPFRPEYADIEWENSEEHFKAWCEGRTGYPLVDAGMRELNQTGYMHNRVRMLVASFLTKHLLIDWRWGERYFAQKLLDFELASNVGNWQWAAGCGCDAAPYFRVFNPMIQQQKFDPQGEYIQKWVPEWRTKPLEPIVEHTMARNRALAAYKKAVEGRRAKKGV